jgi:hypothetical protein
MNTREVKTKSSAVAPLKMIYSNVSVLGGSWGPSFLRPSVPNERTVTPHSNLYPTVPAPANRSVILSNKIRHTVLESDGTFFHVYRKQDPLITNVTLAYQTDPASNIGRRHCLSVSPVCCHIYQPVPTTCACVPCF